MAHKGRRSPRGRRWRRHSRRRSRVHGSRSWLRTRTGRWLWSWEGDNGNAGTGVEFRRSPRCRRRRRDPRRWAGIDRAGTRARTRTRRWLRSGKGADLSFEDAVGSSKRSDFLAPSSRESSIAKSRIGRKGLDSIGTLGLVHPRRDVRISSHCDGCSQVTRSNR